MLKERILTALVLVPVALCGLFLLRGAWFALFVGLVSVLGAWEWARLAGWTNPAARIAYAALVALLLCLLWQTRSVPGGASVVLVAAALWWLAAAALVVGYPASARHVPEGLVRGLIGLLVLLPTWQGLVLLKSWPSGNGLILAVLLLVWSADIGAYFAGRAWGRHKLAPQVSPGKSWEGFIGGLTAALAVAFALLIAHGETASRWLPMLLGAAVVVAVSVLGDLTESLFKRQVGVKDSSRLLPGHGGVLDRIDSLTAAVPLYTTLLWIVGWKLS